MQQNHCSHIDDGENGRRQVHFYRKVGNKVVQQSEFQGKVAHWNQCWKLRRRTFLMIVANSVFAQRCAGLFGLFWCYDTSAVFSDSIVGCLRSCMILSNMPDSANSFGIEKNSVHTICILFPLNIRRSRLPPCKRTTIMAIIETVLVFACLVGLLAGCFT